MRRFWKRGTALTLPLLVTSLFAGTPALAQDAPIPPGTDTAEGVVHELYDMCTFDAGTLPDWDAMRALFLPQATVVLRATRTSNTIFSVDGFVEDVYCYANTRGISLSGAHPGSVRSLLPRLGQATPTGGGLHSADQERWPLVDRLHRE